MAISLKHAFTSAKSDPGDTTLVRPTNWNAEHTITCATDTLLGRTTAGTGAVEEITISDFMQTLLNTADVAALLTAMGIGAFTTGDVKPTLKTSADTGWVMCNDGTIGNAASAGTTRANADTATLYALLWNNVSDTYAAVSTGRGASAAADYAANKTIALTKMLGRALASAGAGSGLTSRALGLTTGTETHTLTKAEAPSGLITLTDPTHAHELQIQNGGSPSGAVPYPYTTSLNNSANYSADTTAVSTGITLTDNGSDDAHNNMQPSAFVNFMVKL